MTAENFRGLPIEELTVQRSSELPVFADFVTIDGKKWKLDKNSKPEYIPRSYLTKAEAMGGYWRATYFMSDTDGKVLRKSLFWDEAELVKTDKRLPTYDELKVIEKDPANQPEFPQHVMNPATKVQMTLKRVFWEVLITGAWMGEYTYEGQQTENGPFLTYTTAMENELI